MNNTYEESRRRLFGRQKNALIRPDSCRDIRRFRYNLHGLLCHLNFRQNLPTIVWCLSCVVTSRFRRYEHHAIHVINLFRCPWRRSGCSGRHFSRHCNLLFPIDGIRDSRSSFCKYFYRHCSVYNFNRHLFSTAWIFQIGEPCPVYPLSGSCRISSLNRMAAVHRWYPGNHRCFL